MHQSQSPKRKRGPNPNRDWKGASVRAVQHWPSLALRARITRRICAPLALGLAALACAVPAAAENLLTNPGFEDGTAGWLVIGEGSLSLVDQGYDGRYAVAVTGRTESWHGLAQPLTGVLHDQKTYRVSAWVRLDGVASDRLSVTIIKQDDDGVQYLHPYSGTAYRDRWTEVAGMFSLQVKGSLENLYLLFEGPAGEAAIFLDEIVVEEVNWKSAANRRIAELRKRVARITVIPPAAGYVLDIRQKRHHFGFGAAIDTNLLNNAKYADFFVRHFEWAVPDSELKWYVNEPEPGQPAYATAEAMAQFCAEHDIRMRGHSLFWAGESFIQDWVKKLPRDELLAAVRNRLQEATRRFAGRVAHWEVNNEMLDGSFYEDQIDTVDGLPVRVWMFKEAHRLAPDAKLFINDYGPIAFGVRIDEYKEHVRELLDAGAPIDGIGLQCHMPASFNRGLVQSRFDTMAELGLPVWVTEFDLDQADERERARDFEDFLRIAFSHPAVEGVILWGFWESAHWRGAGHIVNADWSLNEAGRRYRALLEEWTTKTRGTTDATGRVYFTGFHGTYDVTVTAPDGTQTTATVVLTPETGTAELEVRLPE